MQRKPLPQPSKDNKQISEYTNAIERGLKNYYIFSSNGTWSVRKANTSNAGNHFNTKDDAIAHAKNAASSMADIVIHNEDGSITLIELKTVRASRK